MNETTEIADPSSQAKQLWHGLDTSQEFALLGNETLTQERLHHYAWASGDYNPIHFDNAAAQSMGLPSVIAHGLLIMGIVNRELEKLSRTVAAHCGSPIQITSFDARFGRMTLVNESLSIAAKVHAHTEFEVSIHFYVYKKGERSSVTCTGSIVIRRELSTTGDLPAN